MTSPVPTSKIEQRDRKGERKSRGKGNGERRGGGDAGVREDFASLVLEYERTVSQMRKYA
ncbi:hypothetical protein Hypma_012095 [Hypsizygus marmoreus]|uniref:Uncharacterized protein n=1 Tax=Hypsizygus marmoreus TaxID=39966 RepID=A0A369JPD3_HYPMA|nr:hypothetical protein Hypma_012095 [Hypsizygus marmoreus]